MRDRPWQELADTQAGLISRRQLSELGVDRFQVRNHVAAERWVERSSVVIGTTTGPLSRHQLIWLGLLHAGPAAVLGDLTAAEVAGLRNWHRDEISVLVPWNLDLDEQPDGIRIARTRRPIPLHRYRGPGPARWRIEPAILHFAAYQRSRRTAQGVVAAAVQQQLTDPARLVVALEQLRPLRWAPMFRQVIGEIAGGSQSLAEIDVLRLCRTQRLRGPDRQTRRRDATGRLRFTDCEWRLPGGRVVVLEVDGAFHMEVEHWEDDIARQRQLSDPSRMVIRCTAREVREEPELLGRDLRRLGVPGRAA
jgi:very-short-patch-repair endonuclease